MKKILLVMTALAFTLPTVTFAATYQYVNTAGQINSVDASSPSQAFLLATNIAPDSGVILVSGTSGTGSVGVPNTGAVGSSSGSHTYQYVTVNGQIGSVQANSAAEAFMFATNIAPQSGVILIN